MVKQAAARKIKDIWLVAGSIVGIIIGFGLAVLAKYMAASFTSFSLAQRNMYNAVSNVSRLTFLLGLALLVLFIVRRTAKSFRLLVVGIVGTAAGFGLVIWARHMLTRTTYAYWWYVRIIGEIVVLLSLVLILLFIVMLAAKRLHKQKVKY